MLGGKAMRRSTIVVASMLAVILSASSMPPLIPLWNTTGGPLGGRVRDIESFPTGGVVVGGEAMTTHRGTGGALNGFLATGETSGLPPFTRDFGISDANGAFQIAANGENGGITGGVFLTQNWTVQTGGTWTELTTGLPVKFKKEYLAAAVESAGAPQIAHVGHAAQGLYSTANGGSSWTLTLANVSVNALAIDPTNGSIAFAATSAGTYMTATGGAPWALVDPGAPTVDVVIEPSNPQHLYAVRPTEVRRSTTGGGAGSWASSFPPGAGYDLRAITRPHPANPTLLYVCGAATPAGPAGTLDGDGVIYRSVNSGLTWSANLATYGTPCFQTCGPFPRHNPFNAVAFHVLNPDLLFVGLDGGGAWWSPGTPAGAPSCLPGAPPCFGALSATPTFGEGNSLFAGAPPDSLPLIGTEIRELAAQPNVPGAGQTATMFAGGDSRTVWFRDPTVPIPYWTSWIARTVPILPPGSGGWGWHAMTSVAYDDQAGRLYVADGTRVQVSTNDGLAWTLLGQTFGGEVTEIAVAPQVAAGQANATLLVGTTVGVYRSANGGATFSAPAGPAGVVNFTFDRNYTTGANHSVFAAVQGTSGGFFRSLDPSDGAGWSPAMNAGLPANPGLTIIGHKGGQELFAGSGEGNLTGIFYSNDQGQTWGLPSTLLGPMARVFGFAAATVGAADVVYASTRGGVLRSSDNGATWTGYSSGLINNSRCGPLRVSFFEGSLRLLVGTEGNGVLVAFAN
jgi:hypothetical protein